MKNNIILFLVTILLITVKISFSQVHWTKHPNNPVKSPGAQASCILDNDTLKMWYATGHLGVPRIKAVWSLDGINWNDYHDGNPVMPLGEEGEWDDTLQDTPEIIKVGDIYKLFYYGDTTARPVHTFSTYDSITSAIGLATSTDGINWEKYSENPVITKGDSASFDGRWIESPTILYDSINSKFYMWYAAMGWDWLNQVGLATSDCGFIWNKYNGNPVINEGPDFYDSVGVHVPSVIKTDDIYEIWYSAMPPVQNSWDSLTIAYAVSLNGKHWIKYSANPVYDTFNPQDDSLSIWAPEVVYIQDSNKYLMFYDLRGVNGIHLATSTRNVLYSENCNISVSENITIEQGQNANLLATGGDYYHWLPEENLNNPYIASPIASPDTTTTYTVLIVGDTCITTEQVTVYVENISQINENTSKEISIFPNPLSNSNILNINKTLNKADIIITNSVGQVVFNDNNFSGNTILLNKHLKPGMYLIEIFEEENAFKSKIIIK
jgi:hypothetical protein